MRKVTVAFPDYGYNQLLRHDMKGTRIGTPKDQLTKDLGPHILFCHLKIEGISTANAKY